MRWGRRTCLTRTYDEKQGVKTKCEMLSKENLQLTVEKRMSQEETRRMVEDMKSMRKQLEASRVEQEKNLGHRKSRRRARAAAQLLRSTSASGCAKNLGVRSWRPKHCNFTTRSGRVLGLKTTDEPFKCDVVCARVRVPVYT